jgi:glutamate/tyrosine decarboxylase-like PLP-dependent enzyme
MRFDELIRAHGFMRTERPPTLWEADTEDVRFVPLLGEMLGAALSRGPELAELTLNVSNVVVESEEGVETDDSSFPPAGDYVAVTVSGATDFGPDAAWPVRRGASAGLLLRLHERLETAGVRFAYIRRLPASGSFTVFLKRLQPTGSPMARIMNEAHLGLQMTDASRLLDHAASLAKAYLAGVGERPVGATESGVELRERLGGPLDALPVAPDVVLHTLAAAAERGTVASQGPRYFGFVIGGSLPVTTAADWLVSAWDQDAAVYVMSPLVAAVEDIVGTWVQEIAGLDPSWSTGFVTGCQMANFTGLAAGRHAVLEAAGWDVEARGLFGAPPIDVCVSEESHYTVRGALRLLGMGAERVTFIPTDAQGRMRADALAATLAGGTGPCIICAQAGNVNTGAFDPIGAIADAARARNAWVHVDAAFGFWAAASPALAHLTEGFARANSIATDAHKWLNVPYDSGMVFCSDRNAHRRAMTLSAAYIVENPLERDPREYVPEESRRARAVPVYAALRSLGKDGVADLIDRCCRLARRLAERVAAHPRVTVLNDVVLNQVLLRVAGEGQGDDEATRDVIARVQTDGTCWLGGTTWHGMAAIRISVAHWGTTEADIDRSAAAILRAVDESRASR